MYGSSESKVMVWSRACYFWYSACGQWSWLLKEDQLTVSARRAQYKENLALV